MSDSVIPKIVAPPSRRRFASGWDEVVYLRDKIRYWVLRREPRRAHRFVGRARTLLSQAEAGEEAVIWWELRALVARVEHRPTVEADSLVEELKRVVRLWADTYSQDYDRSTARSVIKGYGRDHASEELDRLKALRAGDEVGSVEQRLEEAWGRLASKLKDRTGDDASTLAVIDGDDLDDEERARLHAALEQSADDIEAGRGISAEESLKRLRALRCADSK